MWGHQSLTKAHHSSSPLPSTYSQSQIFAHPQVDLCLFDDSHTQDGALPVTNIIAVGHMARHHGRISVE